MTLLACCLRILVLQFTKVMQDILVAMFASEVGGQHL